MMSGEVAAAQESWRVDEFVRGVDYYELLGVDRGASAAEIKSAYRALARSAHPDVGGNSATFQLLTEAYETLNDPVRRARYDAGSAQRNPTSEDRSESRPARRRGGSGWLRDFGDDPGFVPGAVRMDTADIPWWHAVDPEERVRYVPTQWPEPGPTLGLLGGWTMLLLAGLAVELTSVLLTMWLALLAAAGAVLVALLRRCLDAQRRDRLFAAEVDSGAVFGEPAAEQPAQQLSADVLEQYLTRLPGVRIFHGLAWPGSVFSDVDHAVLCGDRLVLVESKTWLPGHYERDSEGVLWRNGHRFRGGTSRLADAVASFAELVPDVEVRGAVLVYPNRAGAITTGYPGDLAESPMTPEEFVRDVGRWLAENPATIHRDAFRAVLGQLVSE